jgi:hypothetical protein
VSRVTRIWLVAWLGLAACADAPDERAEDSPASIPEAPPELDPTLSAVDLGVHAVGSALEIEVPEGALGATLLGRAHGDFGFVSLVRNGDALVEDFGFDGVRRFLSLRPRVGEREVSMLAMALPQSDAALPLRPGSYELTLAAAGDAPAEEVSLTLWLRDRGAGGVFDVRIFAADGVAEPSYFEAMAERALQGFAGMAVGTVSVHPLPAEALVIDDDAELIDLLQATAGRDGAPAVNVIAVSDMSGMLGSPVGRAAGIPAIGVEHGTELSGLALEISGELWLDAQVLRHEVGHLAGLFHTSDAYGFDPLSDTPTCEDVDGDGCLDEHNAMFPRPSPVRSGLSETQQRIVLGSTLYRVVGGPAVAPPRVTPNDDARMTTSLGHLAPIAEMCALDASRVTADAHTLLAFGLEPSRAPVWARKRALLLAGMRGGAPLQGVLETVARDPDVSEPLRIGALRGLAAASPAAGRSAALTLGNIDGPLGAVARGLTQRLLGGR